MLDLVSLKDAVAMQAAAVPTRKSAGLAWLLSRVGPGAGYFSTGRYLRGGLVFGFSLIGLIALASAVASVAQRSSSIIGSLIVELPILWVFGFLDAYMTTVESNRGIDPTVVDNPRVSHRRSRSSTSNILMLPSACGWCALSQSAVSHQRPRGSIWRKFPSTRFKRASSGSSEPPGREIN